MNSICKYVVCVFCYEIVITLHCLNDAGIPIIINLGFLLFLLPEWKCAWVSRIKFSPFRDGVAGKLALVCSMLDKSKEIFFRYCCIEDPLFNISWRAIIPAVNLIKKPWYWISICARLAKGNRWELYPRNNKDCPNKVKMLTRKTYFLLLVRN